MQNNDFVNVCSLTGRPLYNLPESLGLDHGYEISVELLAAHTGCDLRSGALFNTSSMGFLVGMKDQYNLENIFTTEPEFDFVFRDRNLFATYPNSLENAWGNRIERIANERKQRAAQNLFKGTHTVECSSDWI